MTNFSHLIPLFPLFAFVINILFGRQVGRKAAWISVLASLISCAIALPMIAAVAKGGHFVQEWTWLYLGTYPLKFGTLLDPLSATLLFVVTIVGTLIQIYSIGYMHNDPRYSRFLPTFSYSCSRC